MPTRKVQEPMISSTRIFQLTGNVLGLANTCHAKDMALHFIVTS